jgi:hypothetical protein
MQGHSHDDPAVRTIAAPGVAYCRVQCVTQSHVLAEVENRCRELQLKAAPQPQLEDEMCPKLKRDPLSGQLDVGRLESVRNACSSSL